jgi:hypothetical protein
MESGDRREEPGKQYNNLIILKNGKRQEIYYL